MKFKTFAIFVLAALIVLAQAWVGEAAPGHRDFLTAQSGPPKKPIQHLTPQQQEQIRKNYLKFKNLPPQERERIQRNFQEWQQLPPEERERLRQRYEQMNPQEQRGPGEPPGRGNPDRFRNGPPSD